MYSSGWVRPKESFQSYSASEEEPNTNGCFLYFRDNGTAVAYNISPFFKIKSSGDIEALCDAYQTSNIAIYQQKKLRFLNEGQIFRFTDIEQFNNTLKLIKTNALNEIDEIKLRESHTLIHRACRSGCGKDEIDILLRTEGEVENLSFQDDGLRWTPLHYACRFSPKDVDLIEYLVELCDAAILKKDRYGRYPLHIACDSLASTEVISILLRRDRDCDTLNSATLNLKWLPLHIALNRGATLDVIQLLLKKERSGMNCVRTSTKIGRLPLHIAIEKRLSYTIIKALLEADSLINKSDLNSDDDDIYQTFKGRLPREYLVRFK